jgi:hypothetical protein
MLRTFVCALLALVLVAGVALAKDDKKPRKRRFKGTVTGGKFVTFKDGKLTINAIARKKRGKKGEKGDAKSPGENKTFDVPEGTTVTLVKEDGTKMDVKSPAGLKDAKAGTWTAVFQDKEKKVVKVRLGKRVRKAKGKKKKADE